jgi:hypothetical protein
VSRVVAARARTGQALHTSRLLRSRRTLGQPCRKKSKDLA